VSGGSESAIARRRADGFACQLAHDGQPKTYPKRELDWWFTPDKTSSSPEVRFWSTTRSGAFYFKSEVVVHRLAEFLFASEIAFRCLNRGVTQ